MHTSQHSATEDRVIHSNTVHAASTLGRLISLSLGGSYSRVWMNLQIHWSYNKYMTLHIQKIMLISI